MLAPAPGGGRGGATPSPPLSRTLVLGIVVLALAGLFVRLGVWQLERAAERRAANEVIRGRMAQPPLVLDGVEPLAGPDAERLAWRMATASGAYDVSREAVARGRTLAGVPGVDLLAPLRLEHGEVWVNRGWVPSPDAATVDAAAFREAGPVRVRGLLRPPERAESAAATGVRLVLQRLPQRGAAGYPRSRPGPGLARGPHLSYAIQWFAFAAIALVGFGAYVLTQRRETGGDTGTRRRREGS